MTPTAARLRRPLTVLVALFLGLGVLGATTGAALGAVGTGAPPGHGQHHHHDDPRLLRPGR